MNTTQTEALTPGEAWMPDDINILLSIGYGLKADRIDGAKRLMRDAVNRSIAEQLAVLPRSGLTDEQIDACLVEDKSVPLIDRLRALFATHQAAALAASNHVAKEWQQKAMDWSRTNAELRQSLAARSVSVVARLQKLTGWCS